MKNTNALKLVAVFLTLAVVITGLGVLNTAMNRFAQKHHLATPSHPRRLQMAPIKHYRPLRELLGDNMIEVVDVPPKLVPDPRGRAPAGGVEATGKPEYIVILSDQAWDEYEGGRIIVHTNMIRGFGWANGEAMPVEVDFLADNGVAVNLDIQKQGMLSYQDGDDLQLVPDTLHEEDEVVTKEVTKHKIFFKVMTTEARDVNQVFTLNLKLRYSVDVPQGTPSESIPWRVLETTGVDTTTIQMAGAHARLEPGDLADMPLREPPLAIVCIVVGTFLCAWNPFARLLWQLFCWWLSRKSKPEPDQIAWKVLLPLFERGLETATREEVGQIEKTVREYLTVKQGIDVKAIQDKNARRKRKVLLIEPVQIPFLSVTKEEMKRSQSKGGYANYPQAELIARFLEICEGIGREATAPLSEKQIGERKELQKMLPPLVDVPDELEKTVNRKRPRK
jgi:hypothetical protein